MRSPPKIAKVFTTKDSGERREYQTGSVRDRQAGKGRFDLVPLEPIRRLAGLYERGAIKYGDSNWQKGQPLMASFFDSAFRHLADLRAGEPSEDHAAAVLWNIVGYMWTLDEIEAGRLPADLDDRQPPAPRFAGCSIHDGDDCDDRRPSLPLVLAQEQLEVYLQNKKKAGRK